MKLDKRNWEKVKFGDVCSLVNENTKSAKEDGLEYVIGLEHITPNDLHIRSWSTTDTDTTFTRIFRKGQVLFGRRRTYQRKVAYTEFEGICSGDIMVFQAKENLLPELLPFIVQSEGFFQLAVNTSAGSLSPRTKFNDLANYEFLLPPKEEQARLAELLWAADEVVESVSVIKNTLGIINRLLLQSLSVLNRRSETKLGNIVDFHYGKALKESERKKGDYPVVGSAGVTGCHDKFIIEGPGIVVGRKGASGNVTWVEENFWPIDTAYWVNVKNKEINLYYIYLLLKSMELDKLSITTAIPGLNREDALSEKANIPSFKEQNMTLSEFEKLNDSFRKQKTHINNANQLKINLINQIF